MTGPGTLTSYAQCLRVIGQQLDTVGITTFELEMNRDDYTVHLGHGDTKPKSEKGFFRNVAERLGAQREAPQTIYFAASDLVWLDLQWKAKRGSGGGMPDPGKLSLNLRVLGDHLDRKSAVDFGISWGQDAVKVRYGNKQESFTIGNLYDLGVHMYLRRSGRR
jgi:hypothetical protein